MITDKNKGSRIIPKGIEETLDKDSIHIDGESLVRRECVESVVDGLVKEIRRIKLDNRMLKDGVEQLDRSDFRRWYVGK